jgi:hypothetical protein
MLGASDSAEASAFVKTSPFVKTSARQVGATSRSHRQGQGILSIINIHKPNQTGPENEMRHPISQNERWDLFLI